MSLRKVWDIMRLFKKYRYSSQHLLKFWNNWICNWICKYSQSHQKPVFQNYCNMLTTVYPKRCYDSFEKYSDHPLNSSEFMGKGKHLCSDSRSTVHVDLTCKLSINGGWLASECFWAMAWLVLTSTHLPSSRKIDFTMVSQYPRWHRPPSTMLFWPCLLIGCSWYTHQWTRPECVT